MLVGSVKWTVRAQDRVVRIEITGKRGPAGVYAKLHEKRFDPDFQTALLELAKEEDYKCFTPETAAAQ